MAFLSYRSNPWESDDDDDVPSEPIFTKSDPPPRCVCNKNDSRSHVCKVYGNYRCTCGKTWTSGNSWYDWAKKDLKTQECRGCKTSVQPYDFRRLKLGNTNEGRGAHRVDLCGRCKELGTDCSKMTLIGGARRFRSGRY
eukprot:m.139810 g.139810  ORF g.139810 m.139810 type:complete len:139 (+) comp17069_c1_seq2:854-1270(+)